MRTRLALPLTGLLFAPSFLIPGAALSADCAVGVAAAGPCTVPANVFEVTVGAWGGGGAGGGSGNASIASARGGGGGGGGGFAQSAIAVTPGETLNVIVGAGGAGSSAANGANGGDSTIDGYQDEILAKGGAGGIRNVSGGPTPTGGAGGSANIGDSTANGANGTAGATGYGISSGAGGKGADAGGGAGGAAISDIGGTSNGNAGSAPGGAGSGSRTSQSGGSRTGGAGAAGRVTLAFTVSDPDPALSGITVGGGPGPVNVPADGSSSATIAVTVVDGDENPLSGSVVLGADSATTVITPLLAPTTTGAFAPMVGATATAPLIDGVATFTVTNTVVESVTYSAVAYTDPDQPPPVNGFAPAAIADIGDGVVVVFQALPPPVGTAIPTMSAYGLFAMTGLLGLLAGWHQRRRRG